MSKLQPPPPRISPFPRSEPDRAALLAALVDSSEDAIIAKATDGTILSWNRAAERIFGYGSEEVVGRHITLLAPPERRDEIPRILAAIARGERVEHYETERVCKDGRRIYVSLSVSPIRDATGRIIGAAKIARDITEQRRLQEAMAFLAEASGILAASLDVDATLESLARLTVPRLADYCQIFELDEASGELRQIVAAHADPAREPLLLRFGELYRVRLDSAESAIATAIRSGSPQLRSTVGEPELAERLRGDGEVLALVRALGIRSAIVAPLASRGRTLGALVLSASESGRHYGERDLELAHELARRAATTLDNARLYREVREASAAKDQFLATLSHELRTPLTPVLALVSSLESDASLPRHAARAVERIRRNVELEARLIDDLLDLTRVARGKLELKREVADLRRIVEHAVETACAGKPDGWRPKVEVQLAAADHRLWGDAPRLTQVFWNLLQNACKFTTPEGEVRVSSRREEGPAGAELAVEVADTGIGIDPEVLPTIFDAFEQGRRGIARRFGGLGLGLAVSKAIVEMHGGTIRAASEGPGKGATFTVRLPVGELPARAAPPAPAETGNRAGASRPLHVLLVEDHADTAEVMADLLRAFGHRVTPAYGVAQALAQAEAAFAPEGGDRIDLVVSDLGLQDGSGLDLMRELARRFDLRGIALSGYGMEEDMERSREAGFLRHLTKPVDVQALLSVIRECTA